MFFKKFCKLRNILAVKTDIYEDNDEAIFEIDLWFAKCPRLKGKGIFIPALTLLKMTENY